MKLSMLIETNDPFDNFKYEYPNNRSATPEEFKKLMLILSDRSDAETNHVDMDNLMCKLLTDLGYGEGIEVFYNTYKWYS